MNVTGFLRNEAEQNSGDHLRTLGDRGPRASSRRNTDLFLRLFMARTLDDTTVCREKQPPRDLCEVTLDFLNEIERVERFSVDEFRIECAKRLFLLGRSYAGDDADQTTMLNRRIL